MEQENNELALETLNKAIINIPDYAMVYVYMLSVVSKEGNNHNIFINGYFDNF